tara:strand:- start:4194 stop:5393 length:1200 start_codon:yes stop_codon:yes gene_type:complete
MKKNINSYLLIYLSSLAFFYIFFLYFKHLTGNDSTVAEYLINYEGGFTKRGIIGQISIIFSRILDLELRFVIYLIQVLFSLLYLFLIYNFFKFYKFNRLTLLALFSPIFILYPVAEIEVLARKEIIVFVLFLIYLFIPQINYVKSISLSIFFVLAILIWEPTIFFIPIILALEIVNNKIKKFDLELVKIVFCLVPGLMIAFYIALNPISNENYMIMKSVLKNEFGEACYGACSILYHTSTISDQFEAQNSRYSIEVVLRYFLIILVGFAPLFILLKNSYTKNKNLFFFKNFNNLLYPTLILLLPAVVLFPMAYDWARWVNISYVYAIIFYFYLSKKNFINTKNSFQKNYLFKLSKKTFIIFFIIFCFSWNPKTVMTDDVGSIPIYRIPYKAIKTFNNNF